MSRRALVLAFSDEHALLEAVAFARASGEDVLDVHGPYPVHGLPEALGEAPSRLPWVCLAGGLLGLLGGLWLQAWTSATDWPLNVGGKPLRSWPAFVPVAFELTVLLAGLLVVAAFLWVDRRRRPCPPVTVAARATDDLFLMTLGARDATFDAERLAACYRDRFGADASEEVLLDEEGRS